jgi:hypothetical protein
VSITEYERHQIFQWCEEAMGPERAAIMMELLPPVGWGDIATRAELVALEQRLDARIERLEGRMELVAARNLRTMVLAMLAGNASLVGAVVAVVQLG